MSEDPVSHHHRYLYCIWHHHCDSTRGTCDTRTVRLIDPPPGTSSSLNLIRTGTHLYGPVLVTRHRVLEVLLQQQPK